MKNLHLICATMLIICCMMLSLELLYCKGKCDAIRRDYQKLTDDYLKLAQEKDKP